MSGNATAQGLQAQNDVSTSANVGVHIGGDNYGTINVAINTVTQIVNTGVAAATSGLASAMGGNAITSVQATGPSAGSGSTVTTANTMSGNVSMTGAVANNQVNLGSTTNIKVNGDNHDPIHVVITLAVQLVNQGLAGAYSGSAVATGQPANGKGSASTTSSTTNSTSGSADALGLQVLNQVKLWSKVFIDITGTNYAPIDVDIVLATYIYNQGTADAVSGPAQSYGASATTNTTNSGSASSQSLQPTSSTSSISSVQPSTTQLINTTNTLAHSGSGVAIGDLTSVQAVNVQSSIASGSTTSRTALNVATLQVSAKSQSQVTTGAASVGPLPTPEPATGDTSFGSLGATNGSSQGVGNGRLSMTGAGFDNQIESTLSSDASFTLRSYFPEPGLPMMPLQYVGRGASVAQTTPPLGSDNVNLSWAPSGDPDSILAPGLTIFSRPSSTETQRRPAAPSIVNRWNNSPAQPILDTRTALIVALLAALGASAAWRRKAWISWRVQFAVRYLPWR